MLCLCVCTRVCVGGSGVFPLPDAQKSETKKYEDSGEGHEV